MPRIIAVTSARGGVGTSSIALNLAAQLAERGQRVCLLDGERVDTAVGGGGDLQPGDTPPDLAAARARLDAPLIRDGHSFDILQVQAGAARLDELEPAHRQRLAASLAGLEGYDFVLIDAIGGADPGQLGLVLASPEVILTVTPQPHHLSDGYALLKLLAARGYPGGVSLLINRSGHHASAERAYDNFRAAAHRQLDRRVPLLGVVHEDPGMQRGVVAQASLLSYRPESPAAQDLAALGAQLLNETREAREYDMRGFADAWLQAACGTDVLPAVPVAAEPSSGQQARRELQQQIETLAGQIDDLVAEINRLRTEGEDIARLVAAPADRLRCVAVADIETRVAGMASGSEQLPLGEAGFPVYQLRRTGGKLLRVAFHSCDPGPEQTEPQSTSF